ncbi:unnamed protein product [Clavelina lepadiformis]|uniref:Protein aurora borealis n=1 Tax=Clavelina lepadiformis TaxID=159417 RepID=A0ABP0EZ26_CLALP
MTHASDYMLEKETMKLNQNSAWLLPSVDSEMSFSSPSTTDSLECNKPLGSMVITPNTSSNEKEKTLNERFLYPHFLPCKEATPSYKVPPEGSKELPHPEVEYIRPNCFLLTYFTGDPRKMVDYHFSRSFETMQCKSEVNEQSNLHFGESSDPHSRSDRLPSTAADYFDDILCRSPEINQQSSDQDLSIYNLDFYYATSDCPVMKHEWSPYSNIERNELIFSNANESSLQHTVNKLETPNSIHQDVDLKSLQEPCFDSPQLSYAQNVEGEGQAFEELPDPGKCHERKIVVNTGFSQKNSEVGKRTTSWEKSTFKIANNGNSLILLSPAVATGLSGLRNFSVQPSASSTPLRNLASRR